MQIGPKKVKSNSIRGEGAQNCHRRSLLFVSKFIEIVAIRQDWLQ